jgi:hypothetical protein
MGRRPTEQGDPISIRLKATLVAQLTHAADELELSLHDTMRQCMKIGLEDLKRCNYNLAGAIVDQAHKQEIQGWLREPETPYPSPTKTDSTEVASMHNSPRLRSPKKKAAS